MNFPRRGYIEGIRTGLVVNDGIGIEGSVAVDSLNRNVAAGQGQTVGVEDFVDLIKPAGGMTGCKRISADSAGELLENTCKRRVMFPSCASPAFCSATLVR